LFLSHYALRVRNGNRIFPDILINGDCSTVLSLILEASTRHGRTSNSDGVFEEASSTAFTTPPNEPLRAAEDQGKKSASIFHDKRNGGICSTSLSVVHVRPMAKLENWSAITSSLSSLLVCLLDLFLKYVVVTSGVEFGSHLQ
jgi:hypothetical protein